MSPTLLVVYDDGAAHLGDIAVGLAGWARCVFVAEPNEHTIAMRPLLTQLGPVIMADTVAEAAGLARTYAPEGLVTYSERALRPAAELADRLDLRFHGSRTVDLLTDKWEQRNALRQAGVDSVRCRRVDSVTDWADAVRETGLPAVLKPVHGAGSRNTFLIEDAAAGLEVARGLLAESRPGLVAGGTLVLEEYLVGRDCGPFGDYVSVESLVQDGRVGDLAVTGKFPLAPPFRETGRFWPAPLEADETIRIRALARAAVQALGIRSGLTHTEVKLTPDGPRLIEVNGRLGGGIDELARRAIGLNLVELAGRAALGEQVDLPPPYDGRAYFQLFHPAPRRAGTLRDVDGVAETKRINGVTLYRPYVHPGDCLAGGVQTRELGIVMGEAASVMELADIADKINSTLRYRFEFPTGPDTPPEVRTVAGTDLGLL